MIEIVIMPLFLLGGLYGSARLSLAALERVPIAAGRHHTVLKWCRRILYGVAVVAVWLVQVNYVPGETVLSLVTAGRPSGRAVVIANGLSLGLLLALSDIALHRGFEPVLAKLHDYVGVVDRRLRRRRRIAVAVCLILGGLVYEGVRTGTIDIVAALIVVLLLFYIFDWVTTPVTVQDYAVRKPEPAERERVENWYDDLGESPDNIVVITDDSAPERAVAGGRGATRWLWIHENLFARMNDQMLTIILAQAEAKRRRHFWPLAATTMTLYWLVILVPIALLLPSDLFDWSTLIALNPVPWPYSPLIAVIVVIVAMTLPAHVGAWVTRRSTFRADDEVVSRFGVDRVIEAYRQSGSLHFYDAIYHAVEDSNVALEPSTAQRVERLREKHAVESGQQPERFESDATISPRFWPLVIGVSTVFWTGPTVYYAIALWSDAITYSSPYSVLEFTAAFAWYGIVIWMYKDTNRLQAMRQWPRYRRSIVALSMIPYVNSVVGCWYLWKRRRIILESPDDIPSGT